MHIERERRLTSAPVSGLEKQRRTARGRESHRCGGHSSIALRLVRSSCRRRPIDRAPPPPSSSRRRGGGGAGGIWILDPQGKKLGRIVHGQPATTNIAFGSDDWRTLYFTSRTHLGSVNLKIAGIPVPVPAAKKS